MPLDSYCTFPSSTGKVEGVWKPGPASPCHQECKTSGGPLGCKTLPKFLMVLGGPVDRSQDIENGPCVDWASTAVHAQSHSVLCDRSSWKSERSLRGRRNVVKNSQKRSSVAFDVTGRHLLRLHRQGHLATSLIPSTFVSSDADLPPTQRESGRNHPTRCKA